MKILKYDKNLMKRMLKFARPYWYWIALSIFLLFVITLGDLARPYLIKLAIDNYINVTGRVYRAFEPAFTPGRGIEFENMIWIPNSEIKNASRGKIYTLIQYEKNFYMVSGKIIPNKDKLSFEKTDNGYFIKVNGKTTKSIQVPVDKLKEFRERDLKGLIRLAIIFLLIAAVVFGLNYTQVIILQYTGQKIIYDLRQHIFSHLLKLSLSFFL